MPRRHANENLRTTFKGPARFAGTGVDEEDYSEGSFPDRNPWRYKIGRGWAHPQNIRSYPVKVYKLSEDELKKYREEDRG